MVAVRGEAVAQFALESHSAAEVQMGEVVELKSHAAGMGLLFQTVGFTMAVMPPSMPAAWVPGSMRFRQVSLAKTLLGSRQLVALPPAKIAALPLLSRFWV